MIRKFLPRSLALASTLALAPLVAQAFTVTYQNSSVFGTNGNASARINSVAAPDVGPLNVRAGGFALRGDLYGNGVENFTAFCLDILVTMKSGKNYATTTSPFPSDPLTASQIANIGRLFNTAYGVADLLTNAAKSAGFQLALWEIIYETSATFSLGSGNFTATNSAGATGRANEFLANLDGPTVGKGWNLTFLESLDGRDADRVRDSQNLVTATPVPLPAAAGLLLAALAGLGALRRRARPM